MLRARAPPPPPCSGYGYDATDLAALHHRLVVQKATRLIYVTDSGAKAKAVEQNRREHCVL